MRVVATGLDCVGAPVEGSVERRSNCIKILGVA